MRKLAVLGAAAFALAAAQSAIGATLKVGDAAPPIKVARWVKGQPVDTLEPGKTYVVEFWATWCGPCRVSIPHLTELAHRYAGKVTFIGVDSFEHPKSATDTTYYPAVEKFVKDMGDKMDYHVCIDGPEGTMGTTWMEAAGQQGIPTAFVIGKDRTIQWIGHPLQMDTVLDPVLSGRFDAKAAAAAADEAQRKAEAQTAAMRKLMAPVMAAVGKQDWPTALTEIDKVTAAHPEMASQLAAMRFGILAQADAKAVGPYARKLADTTFQNDPQTLNQIAWSIVDDHTKLAVRDYDAAIYVAQKAAKASSYGDPAILDTLATAYYRKGDKAEAIRWEEKAVALLDKTAGVPDDEKQQMRATLARFKEGK